MTGTMTITLRVPPELRDQLERAAGEHRTSMSAIAVSALRAYLDGAGPVPDGPLVAVVREAYTDIGNVDVERQMALNLARTAEAGGTAGVAAVRGLRELMEPLLNGEDDEWLSSLSVPE
ncbi:hypothetical protein [Streptomyces lavendulae]|uniref:CopG family ribbon-helix-helix protein n=1 Tax=Streptomyces lavendulae TaxID=1914 RepID=UPI0031E723EE